RIDLAEGAACGRLEGVVGGVHGVRRSVVEDDPDARDREPDETALLDHRLEALLAGRDELRRDRAAADLVDELELALAHGLDVPGNAAELACATRLLLVRVVEIRALAHGLAIGDLRGADLDLGVGLALHPLDV